MLLEPLVATCAGIQRALGGLVPAGCGVVLTWGVTGLLGIIAVMEARQSGLGCPVWIAERVRRWAHGCRCVAPGGLDLCVSDSDEGWWMALTWFIGRFGFEWILKFREVLGHGEPVRRLMKRSWSLSVHGGRPGLRVGAASREVGTLALTRQSGVCILDRLLGSLQPPTWPRSHSLGATAGFCQGSWAPGTCRRDAQRWARAQAASKRP